jgi:hypothetical protein
MEILLSAVGDLCLCYSKFITLMKEGVKKHAYFLNLLLSYLIDNVFSDSCVCLIIHIYSSEIKKSCRC